MSRRLLVWGLACVVGPLTGCHALHSKRAADYRTVQANPNRDTARAERLHRKALGILDHCAACYDCECVANALCNPCEAEQLLQDALIADVRYGPAHNTLGTLYLRQRKLYLAAWEFEYAMGLMPERPEPLSNTGLVYEEAGRLGRAIENYEQAVELEPTNAEYIGNLARASLKQGTPLDETRYLLQELLLYDSRPEWIAWAKDLLGTNVDDSSLVNGGEFVFEMLDQGVIETPGGVEMLPMPGAPEPTLIDSEAVLKFPE